MRRSIVSLLLGLLLLASAAARAADGGAIEGLPRDMIFHPRTDAAYPGEPTLPKGHYDVFVLNVGPVGSVTPKQLRALKKTWRQVSAKQQWGTGSQASASGSLSDGHSILALVRPVGRDDMVIGTHALFTQAGLKLPVFRDQYGSLRVEGQMKGRALSHIPRPIANVRGGKGAAGRTPRARTSLDRATRSGRAR